MTLLVVIIGLFTVLIIGLILSLKKFDSLREKYGDVLAYVPASFFAIFLALLSAYLPFYLSQSAEHSTTLELFENAQQDIYQTRQDMIALDTIMRTESIAGKSYAAHVNRNGVPIPRIFLRLLGNENVLKAMNDEMLESSRRFESSLSKILKWLAMDSLSNDQVEQWVDSYGAELWKLEEILLLYIDYLEQGISESDFSARKQAILIRYLKLFKDPDIKERRKKHPWLELGK